MQEDKKIRCALVHDHVLLREGLRRLLEDEPDIEVVAEAENAAEALRKVFEQRPHVVITGTHIFEGAPHESQQLISRENQGSKVLFLSSDDERKSGMARALRQTSAAELVQMVRGAVELAPESPRTTHHKELHSWEESDLLPRQKGLTVRERQVLKLLAEGRTVRSVANVLGLSIKTVDAHKFNLMRKLGLHNKAELVMWAIRERVLKLPANL